MNEPPDQTAVLSEANLLSPTGITVAKYSRNSSGCSFSPVIPVGEDHALLFQVLPDLVVDHLGLVLRGHAGDEALLLGLGDAEPVVGVLDVSGQLVPARCLLLGRAHEVLDVVEVDVGEVGAPGRQRLAVEQPQALQPQVEHPLRLVLLRRDVAHHVLVEAPARRGPGYVGVGPAVLVPAEAGELLSLARRGYLFSHRWVLTIGSGSLVNRCGPGMCVVHTPSPLAIVASRCTCVPTRREITLVSASHSCGNSAATCATGQ